MPQRRKLLATIGLAALAVSFAWPSIAQAPTKFVYSGWGGSWQKSMRDAVFGPFEKETGIKATDVSGSSLAKLKQMVESGNVEWDVVDIIGSWLIVGKRENLFEKLDLSGVDTKGFPPRSVYDTSIAVDSYTVAFAYNTNAFKDRKAPQSWADFWNVKDFPGRRAMFDNPRGTLEFALLADGVPMDKLYPLDVDRAFRKLDELKPSISFYFKQWEQGGQTLADGSVAMSIFTTARAFPMMQQGAPIQIVWNGGESAYDYLVIPRGAKNREAAQKFIAWYANNPKAQADLAKTFAQGPTHPKGLDYLTPAEAEQMSAAHAHETFAINWEWWADNLDRTEERWNEWKLK